MRLGGWELPSGHPQCGGSWRRIPASKEGSLRAAPNGSSKVSCLLQESSALPALVSIHHCPALEVICCFINYLHTMGPLLAPEQHTLAFRSNALTSAHPGQTKSLCAAFLLPSLAPAPTSPRAGHRVLIAPQASLGWTTTRGAWGTLPRDLWQSPAACSSRMGGVGQHDRSWGLAALQHGTEQPVGTHGGGCAGYRPRGSRHALEALPPGRWCQQQQL